MKYTHIGLEDQARALAGLPVPQAAGGKRAENWQRTGSGLAAEQAALVVSRRHRVALNRMRTMSPRMTKTLAKARVTSLFVTESHPLATMVKSGGGGNRTRKTQAIPHWKTRGLPHRMRGWQRTGSGWIVTSEMSLTATCRQFASSTFCISFGPSCRLNLEANSLAKLDVYRDQYRVFKAVDAPGWHKRW